MPFAHAVLRVTASGTCFLGTEEWSTGFYVGNEGANVLQPPSDIAAEIEQRWRTFWTAATTHINNNYMWDQLKVAYLNPDGTTDPSLVSHYYPAAPVAAGGGATIQPPQVALVATLTTAIPRGLAAKGRMYLPGVNVAISGNTGKFSTFTHATDIATNMKTLIDGVNSDLTGLGAVILASKGRTGANPSPPINSEVTGVKVGDVYDTQRRRRNQLQETYATAVIA